MQSRTFAGTGRGACDVPAGVVTSPHRALAGPRRRLRWDVPGRAPTAPKAEGTPTFSHRLPAEMTVIDTSTPALKPPLCLEHSPGDLAPPPAGYVPLNPSALQP